MCNPLPDAIYICPGDPYGAPRGGQTALPSSRLMKKTKSLLGDGFLTSGKAPVSGVLILVPTLPKTKVDVRSSPEGSSFVV